MAWQSPSAMNQGGVAGGGDGNGPAGTEYTLQGVMRFLQLEWHNHERARNAWDIERAEMKAKIAKQEGEVRSAKKLNDQLNKHIRMLEQALLNERARSKAAAAGGDTQAAGEGAKDAKGKAGTRTDSKGAVKPAKPQNKHHNSFLDVDPELSEQSEADRDNLREKSKLYLTKCVEEITYLLTPPAQPPPPQPGMQHALGNGSGFMNHGDGPMEDMYSQHRQKLQSQQNSSQNNPMPNHQPPNIPTTSDIHNLPHQSQQHQAPQMSREPSNQQPLPSHSIISTDFLGQQPHHQPHHSYNSVPEEQIEKVTHAYDSHGRQIPAREEGNLPSGEASSEDPESWNFEEPLTEISREASLPSRPDTITFPNEIPTKSPPRKKEPRQKSFQRRRSSGQEIPESLTQQPRSDPQNFKVRFALRGHLDVVRSVIFTGGGSPSEPEICTAGDDGMIKRWIIPASYANQHSMNNDLDISPYWSHRGHDGVVTSLAACPSSASFATGGRVSGDGWIFSGGQDATIRVWERGRVDPKATLDGHTDAVWTVCVLPATCAAVFGQDCNNYGGPDRILLASGSADGTIKIWAVSAPPQLVSPQTGSRRGVGGSRRHSVTSGSNYPSSPQPSVATSTPFHYMLIHTIERTTHPSPTCISPLSMSGENFIVSFTDASILIYDTRTGEEIIGMASGETYNGTPATGVTSVVAAIQSAEGASLLDSGRNTSEEDGAVHGPTGSSSSGGVEGVVISGHEDQYIRFYDANSGQCTYNMLAHPSAISALSLSKDGKEAVSAGHDASIRFWSLEKRICTQEITAHRIMRGEGVCSVVWSQDGRLVVSAGGDGVVKVFAR
ncbi:striatin Pro11 [Melanomma pulvis-pyrius CBS 109.77]|uniref:Striatin Pro11 n=1 Tax=Melanomma pulvis-pyrius CBS 109.77 TaxID=1314802 RepID=A0A6A6X3X8_9PLEO|nr:striatin Pro11 [Melanomma pulvis-pyrius CBS 109.77]